MTYGITLTGFKIKRLPEIKIELEGSFKGVYGTSINLDERTPEGQLIGLLSEREALIWEKAEQLYYSQYPDTSEGVPLDNAVALTGTERKESTKSTVTATIFGTVGTIVPNTFIASVVNNSDARFKINEAKTILAGIDEVQKIVYSLVPDSGNFTLSYNAEVTAILDFNALNSEIETAIEALTDIEDVSITGDFSIGHTITFVLNSGKKPFDLLVEASNTLLNAATPVTTTITEETEGKLPQVDAVFTAEVAGDTQAPSGNLTVIENPQSGIDSVLNALDAEVGTITEIDSALKARRRNEIAQGGNCTIEAIRASLLDLQNVTAAFVFKNNTDVIDGEGRPPHSLDCVVEGALDSVVAKDIFETAGAGIGFFGSITEIVVDSQGFDQEIKFSRPTGINIWVETDLTTDINFPADGVAQVEAAILAYGNSLEIGDDVIVYTPLISAIGTVEGIIDLVIRIGKIVSPTLDDNIAIAAREKASFDSSRITVLELP